MTVTEHCPDGRSQDLTCRQPSETLSIQETSWQNIHLLPELRRWVVYFVTALQGENKEIIFIGCAKNLPTKFAKHQRKIEFEFLHRMGYQITISWIVLPDATEKEAYAVHRCYRRAFEPKLNDDQNTFTVLQIEESRKQLESWEQVKYVYLEEPVKNWRESGDDQDTVIKKIWDLRKEHLMVNI